MAGPVVRHAGGLALTAYNFPKIGTRLHAAAWTKGAFSTCRSRCRGRRSPQAADDLKARDAVLRRFPEVELIVGKAGRADTPTDPSPLDMVETVITLRPKELWPKRKLQYADAERQTAVVLAALQKQRADRADRNDESRSPRDCSIRRR